MVRSNSSFPASHCITCATALIFRCYGTIHELLVPGGCFLDCDYFKYAGGVAIHMAAMEKVGFERVECISQEGAAEIVKAT